jgi:hypothetical protein
MQMPGRPITFDTVRQLGRDLPDVKEGTVYGSPALKVNGRMFACIAIHRSAEPHTLAVRMSFKDRDRLIADEPATFYLTDHYVNYPCVLVRLRRCSRERLRGLLQTGWTFVASGAKLTPRRQRGAPGL